MARSCAVHCLTMRAIARAVSTGLAWPSTPRLGAAAVMRAHCRSRSASTASGVFGGGIAKTAAVGVCGTADAAAEEPTPATEPGSAAQVPAATEPGTRLPIASGAAASLSALSAGVSMERRRSWKGVSRSFAAAGCCGVAGAAAGLASAGICSIGM